MIRLGLLLVHFVRWLWRRSGEMHVRGGLRTFAPTLVLAAAFSLVDLALRRPPIPAWVPYSEPFVAIPVAWAIVVTVRLVARRDRGGAVD